MDIVLRFHLRLAILVLAFALNLMNPTWGSELSHEKVAEGLIKGLKSDCEASNEERDCRNVLSYIIGMLGEFGAAGIKTEEIKRSYRKLAKKFHPED